MVWKISAFAQLKFNSAFTEERLKFSDAVLQHSCNETASSPAVAARKLRKAVTTQEGLRTSFRASSCDLSLSSSGGSVAVGHNHACAIAFLNS